VHYGPHWPFSILVWYLSDKKWQYGLKQNEEVPVWHTISYHPTFSSVKTVKETQITDAKTLNGPDLCLIH